jgi:hypothetical protein
VHLSGRPLTPRQLHAEHDHRSAEDLLAPQDLPDEDDALNSLEDGICSVVSRSP